MYAAFWHTWRRADPKRGPIAPALDAAKAAAALEAAGCSALAVMTDPAFGGSKEDLPAVAQAVSERQQNVRRRQRHD